MAEFLSAPWVALLDSAALEVDPAVTLALDVVVRGVPGGDTRHRVTLSGGRLRAAAGDASTPDPDATLSLSWATAVGLATGQLTAHAAFLGGQVKLIGDLGCLQEATAALAGLASGLAAVRDRTSYPPVPR